MLAGSWNGVKDYVAAVWGMVRQINGGKLVKRHKRRQVHGLIRIKWPRGSRGHFINPGSGCENRYFFVVSGSLSSLNSMLSISAR
jgi:hypothetical protein